MRFSEREKEKLLIYTAAMLAKDRMARGLKLNHPEAIAVITAAVKEVTVPNCRRRCRNSVDERFRVRIALGIGDPLCLCIIITTS